MSPAIGGWVLVVLGLLLAFTGTTLFWLAVGIAGFAFGWLVTLALFPNVDPLAGILIGLVLGAACAFVAIKGLPIIGIGLGAVLIGLLGLTLAAEWTSDSTPWKVVGFVIGAIVGGLLVKGSITWGIPLVTAIGGGVLVWNGLIEALIDNGPKLSWNWLAPLVAVVVAIAGFAAQLGSRRDSDVAAT